MTFRSCGGSSASAAPSPPYSTALSRALGSSTTTVSPTRRAWAERLSPLWGWGSGIGTPRERSAVVGSGAARSPAAEPVVRGGAPGGGVVAESRPDREGIGVAERVAEAGVESAVCVDAAIAHVLATGSVDAVVLGADTVLADGTLINKVGSRAVAIAADEAEVPVYVVTSSDKISPDRTPAFEAGPTEAV